MVQWLGLHASTARGTGLIPGQGTKIPHTWWHGQRVGGGGDIYVHKMSEYIMKVSSEVL